MAYIQRLTMAIDTTSNESSTGGYFYSAESVCGYVSAVEYVPSTANAVPSTGKVQLFQGSTHMVLEKTASTDSWLVMPRRIAVDSTAQYIGATTAYSLTLWPISRDRRIYAGVTGGTSAQTNGTLYAYVEGA
jgi:hypothetical protein